MNGIALFLHLLGVVLLVAAVTNTVLTTLRVQTSASVAELRSLTAVTKRIEFAIAPAMLLIIGSGVYMVIAHGDGSNPWTSGWVVTSLVVTVLLAVIGNTVEASDAKRLNAAIADAPGAVPQGDLRERQLASRPIYVVFFGTSQVVALLFVMTNRPDYLTSIAACLIAAAVSALAAFVRVRSVRRSRRVPVAGVEA